jgi:CLIP-associating protein 1/2
MTLCLILLGPSPHIFFVAVQISNEANQCLNVLLAKYDPFRCLAVCINIFSYCSPFSPVQFTILGLQWSLVDMQVIAPLLVSDDEKILVYINCLTKVPHNCRFILSL